MRTKNHNHMMYGSWDMECDRQKFSLWTVFCCFTSLWTQKMKIFKKSKKKKKKKKTWRYYKFTNVYHKWQSYDAWFFRYRGNQTKFFVILDRFLAFYPPNNPKNQNFEKLKKICVEYHHFTQVYQKSRSYAILFLRYGA